MEFYSHAKEKNNQKFGSKLLKEHLLNVAANALLKNYEIINLDLDKSQLQKIIIDLCKFHDLGKYTSFFQQYLLNKNYNNKLKEHSKIGSFAILNKYCGDELLGALLYFIVDSHHRDLEDILNIDIMQGEFEKIDIYEKQINDLKNNIDLICNEIGEKNLQQLLKIPETKTFRKIIKRKFIADLDIKYYFLVNYLFSTLIENDKLNASDTKIYWLQKIEKNSVQKQININFEKIEDLEKINSSNLNLLRNYVNLNVLKKTGNN